MNYGAIKYCDVANGIGCRTVLFVSGCRNHCKGCFQPETWDFDYGKPFTKEVEEEIFASLEPDYVSGITLLGGDPFEEENQRGLVGFMQELRRRFPQKSVWAYTGYVYEDLQTGGKKHCEVSDDFLKTIDVLVDGKFVEEQKDIRLKFRGSANQRIIDLKKTKELGTIVLAME